MKRNRVFRLLASLTVVVLCMTAFSVTAFAGGGDGDYYTGESAETTLEPTEEPATGGMEPEGQPLTPEGNATLVDDYYGDKQLITVTTKAGNYFYILIDRANGDKETAVHFLNQVDEADLMALLEDGQTEEPPAACTCAEKCQAGAVNTACPVCAVNMSECAGKAPEVEPKPEPEPEKESGSSGALVLILLLVALGGGGAFAYPTAELRNNMENFEAYYDEIEICGNAASSHPKGAFQIRNRQMVKRSNLVVFYVDHTGGGAYQTIRSIIKGSEKVC